MTQTNFVWHAIRLLATSRTSHGLEEGIRFRVCPSSVCPIVTTSMYVWHMKRPSAETQLPDSTHSVSSILHSRTELSVDEDGWKNQSNDWMISASWRVSNMGCAWQFTIPLVRWAPTSIGDAQGEPDGWPSKRLFLLVDRILKIHFTRLFVFGWRESLENRSVYVTANNLTKI